MNTVSPAQLLDTLLAVRGSRMIGLWAETDPRCRKKTKEGLACPWPGLRKRSRVQAVIGFAWGNSVHAQMLREAGDAAGTVAEVERIVAGWSPQPRTWGERIEGTPLVCHDGKHYLECLVTRALSVGYFTEDDCEVVRAEVEPWLPGRAEWGGPTTKELVIRDYALGSIRALTMGGKTWTVSGVASDGTER